jgi:hypothetical protein
MAGKHVMASLLAVDGNRCIITHEVINPRSQPPPILASWCQSLAKAEPLDADFEVTAFPILFYLNYDNLRPFFQIDGVI